MIRLCLTVFACLISNLCLQAAGPSTVKLQYLPHTPVMQHTHLILSIDQALPALKLDTEAQQNLQAQLILLSEQREGAVLQPPLDLIFQLRGMKINLKANGETASFDSSHPGSSLMMAQVAKMIDRPIKLHFEDDFTIDGGAQNLDLLLRELPVVKELEPQALLQDLFRHLFALAGKELSMGDQILRTLPPNKTIYSPSTYEYVVTAITDQEVQAALNGRIESRTIALNKSLKMDENTEEKAVLTVSGTVSGRITWNRQNAMIYHAEIEHVFSGLLKIADLEWKMTAKLNSDTTTKG